MLKYCIAVEELATDTKWTTNGHDTKRIYKGMLSHRNRTTCMWNIKIEKRTKLLPKYAYIGAKTLKKTPNKAIQGILHACHPSRPRWTLGLIQPLLDLVSSRPIRDPASETKQQRVEGVFSNKATLLMWLAVMAFRSWGAGFPSLKLLEGM